ncbi:UDP-2,3-diacylglucosamine diphosphatase [Uliginosibacterium sp. sgz301328]|uniref:UDP-2,3-diacylglucosamine diphosphatase n=1 Tax=Uliginosibacterium sp. sgz301328 TaxID=3243764 RepID=UPI00359E7EA9
MIRFISDLHLNPAEPATTDAFLRFLDGPAHECETLWILGDLFEYWAGDDDLENPFNAQMADALRAVADSGVDIRVIVGNRDFLLGPVFAERAGVSIVAEPYPIELGGTPAILMHGDSLCTDDLPYMQFRAMVRNPAWQAQFLAQPLAVRRKIAEDLRAKSEMAKQEKDVGIMDVNAGAVERAFHDSGAAVLIHGHTHRPARHELNVDGRACQRWVLADWHGKAQWLEWNGSALSAQKEQ